MKKGIFFSSILISLLLVIPSVISADLFHGYRVGKFDSKLSAYYDSSVTNYGYGPHYDAARTSWANISSDVSISRTYSTSNNPDKYYIGNTSSPGKIGTMIRYAKTSTGILYEATVDEDWLYATAIMYDNSMKNWDLPYAAVLGNAIHEIGHTLKLAHPGQGTLSRTPIPTGRTSVMKQGLYIQMGPQAYDKSELRAKWGN